MSKTANVIWSVVGLVVLIVGVLAVVYGPDLYRHGKALVGPIVDIAQAENEMAALNDEFAFTPPEDRIVPADRFEVFLEIRRSLLPQYRDWQDLERKLERQNQENWQDAMEALSAVQSIMNLQLETLRSFGMSPAEFVWIEDLVYLEWMDHVDDGTARSGTRGALVRTTTDDLDLLAELESRFGSSPATRRFAEHLNERLTELGTVSPPVVEGVPAEDSALFWNHHEELAELDLASYSELHSFIRGADDVEIKVGSE